MGVDLTRHNDRRILVAALVVNVIILVLAVTAAQLDTTAHRVEREASHPSILTVVCDHPSEIPVPGGYPAWALSDCTIGVIGGPRINVIRLD